MPKLFLTAFSIGDTLNSVDAANALVRAVRQADRTLSASDAIGIPLVDGCSGTLEFLVGHTLGSYVEVEATDATGDQAIVPFGLCGSDEKLAVIEMQSIAGVDTSGDRGTTFGVGELIQDVLDEGAFSVLLGLEEPLGRDAGLGLAAALGVKFFDSADAELDLRRPDVDLSRIHRIDASARSFETLAARFFVARATPVQSLDSGDRDFREQLRSLATIVKRDIGIDIPVDTRALSTSAIEFGLIAFLSAAIRDGIEIVMEAAEIEQQMMAAGSGALVVFARDEGQVSLSEAVNKLVEQAEKAGLAVIFLFANGVSAETLRQIDARSRGAIVRSLQDITLFQAPLTAASKPDEIRRNLLMRLEKLIPGVLGNLQESWTGRPVA